MDLEKLRGDLLSFYPEEDEPADLPARVIVEQAVRGVFDSLPDAGDEREAFEAYLLREWGSDDGVVHWDPEPVVYQDGRQRCAEDEWHLWQAARALPSTDAEAVAEIRVDLPGADAVAGVTQKHVGQTWGAVLNDHLSADCRYGVKISKADAGATVFIAKGAPDAD